MKAGAVFRRSGVVFGAILMLVFFTTQVLADAESNPRILVKVRDLSATVALMDQLMATGEGPSPAAQLSGMLQGLDWIDPTLSIIAQIDLTSDIPSVLILVPFRYTNDAFSNLFNAKTLNNNYLIQIPPNPDSTISEAVVQSLVNASIRPANNTLSVEIPVSELLTFHGDAITGLIDKAESQLSSQQPAPNSLSPQTIRELFNGILDFMNQMHVFTLGLDLNNRNIRFATEILANSETELAALFSHPSETVRLAAYQPEGHFIWRSRAFDVDRFSKVFLNSFGKIYKAMGLDIEKFMSMTRYFTGETVSGMSFSEKGMTMEMVMVLKNMPEGQSFIDDVYFPLITEYEKNLSEMIRKNGGPDIPAIFTRLPDMTMDGHKVSGLHIKMPILQGNGSFQRNGVNSMNQIPDEMIEMSFRMSTVGDLFLIAPDETRMKQLIRRTKSFKQTIAKGPMMMGEMNMGAYYNYLSQMMPQSPAGSVRMPEKGKMMMTADMGEGKASTTMSLDMDFIKGMIAAVQRRDIMEDTASSRGFGAAPSVKSSKPAKPATDDPAYWIDRGNFFTVYGNYQSAIKCYEKALKLKPGNSTALFNLGIAQGELGDYETAILSINRAIELNPENGTYYYGRGRILMLTGDKSNAMNDFVTAADLGNSDAQAYLQKQKK